MILVEPFRFSLLIEKGAIVVNEDLQKFKVILNSQKVIKLETYDGKKPPTMFVFMGNIPESPGE